MIITNDNITINIKKQRKEHSCEFWDEDLKFLKKKKGKRIMLIKTWKSSLGRKINLYIYKKVNKR